jgi:hypothetical protein
MPFCFVYDSSEPVINQLGYEKNRSSKIYLNLGLVPEKDFLTINIILAGLGPHHSSSKIKKNATGQCHYATLFKSGHSLIWRRCCH